MASILDRYGIKEVADVTFYELNDEGKPTNPVLYLDTLKVSTVETTAENTSARGGKGNAELISWDYGKEINVTLEDALFSAKSMAIMFGASTDVISTSLSLKKTITFTADTADESGNFTVPTTWHDANGDYAIATSMANKIYNETGEEVATPNFAGGNTVATGLVEGNKYFYTFDVAVTGQEIEISADTFPDTYYITGDTYARSEASGKDEGFQFIIPKAKVLSENTLTLEAEGDPSTFSMNLKVLRPDDGKMMKLVKYSL